jgi:hypothetical protein
MTSTLQSVVIAFVIGFLLAILIGYFWMQGRLKRQAEALKDSQRRLEEMEQSHEARLRETTQQLRRDYEADLTETIEHYQDHLSQKTLELEQTYETRFKVLQQGDISSRSQDDGQSATVSNAVASTRPPTSSSITTEPVLSESDASALRTEVLHLKRQYEMRLKEAAHKLQKAYERQLAQHVKAVKSDLKADYDRKLLEQTEVFEQQLAKRQAELEEEFARPQDRQVSPGIEAPVPTQTMMLPIAEKATPSQIMSTGDDTTMTLFSPDSASAALQPASPEYIQDEIDTRIDKAAQQIREEYGRQLSEKLDQHQQQMSLRIKELEAEYAQKIERLSRSLSDSKQDASDGDDDFSPLDLSDIS